MTRHPPNMALEDAIRNAGMTRKQLAKKAKISVGTIHRMVYRLGPPNPITAIRVARALGTTPEALELISSGAPDNA